jgi:hypothetical protein
MLSASSTVSRQTQQPRIALYYGHARTPLALVVPDARRSGMWRIAGPDGRLSDLVNLARAKDAAAMIAERGPPARNRRRLHWKIKRSKAARRAPPIASTDATLSMDPGAAELHGWPELLQHIAAAPSRVVAERLFHLSDDAIATLPEGTREKLRAALQDTLAELPQRAEQR